jgi:hypothetical protein
MVRRFDVVGSPVVPSGALYTTVFVQERPLSSERARRTLRGRSTRAMPIVSHFGSWAA